jgi:hypothetical protein
VEAFGSTEYGVSNANSDLDLVIIVSFLCMTVPIDAYIILYAKDPDRMEGFPPGTSLTKLPGGSWS